MKYGKEWSREKRRQECIVIKHLWDYWNSLCDVGKNAWHVAQGHGNLFNPIWVSTLTKVTCTLAGLKEMRIDAWKGAVPALLDLKIFRFFHTKRFVNHGKAFPWGEGSISRLCALHPSTVQCSMNLLRRKQVYKIIMSWFVNKNKGWITYLIR